MLEWLLLVATVGLTCCGQVLQKITAERWQAQNQRQKLLHQAALWVALLCLGLATLCWLYLLQLWDVSRAYPLLSINFVLMLLIAHWLFNEEVRPKQWLGVGFIVSGIVLLAKT